MVPYTFIIIMPVNKRLLDPNVDRDSPNTKRLLEKWGRLHAGRTIISFCALVLFFVNLTLILKEL